MKKTLLLVGLMVFALGGCQTTPLSSDKAAQVPKDRLLALQDKPAAESARLVVTRDTGVLGSACQVVFFVDGVQAARFEPGETASFHVPIGERIIGTGPNTNAGLCGIAFPRKEIATLVKPGEVKKYRISSRYGDVPTIEPTTLN